MSTRNTGRRELEPDADSGGGFGDFAELDEAQLVGTQGVDVTFDRRAADWLAQENYERLTAKVSLYKFDHPTTGEAKALVDTWENEIPEQHEVGLAHGSGRYLLLVTFPQGEKQTRGIRGWRFRLHANYDALRAEHLRAQAAINPQAPGLVYGARGPMGPQSDPLTQGLDAVAKLVGVLAPLLVAQKGGGSAPDMQGMLAMYKGMGDIMKASARENVEFFADMQRQVLGLPAPQPEGEDVKEEGVLEKLMPLLAEWVPVMLGQGPKAQATAATVRALPLFKQVVKSKGEVARIVQYLDGAYGPAQTDTLLARLHVSRPQANNAAAAVAVPQRRVRPVKVSPQAAAAAASVVG